MVKLLTYLGTFIIIVLCELGDKTQVATLIFSSNNPSKKWQVFGAAGVALCLCVAIEVTVGTALARIISPSTINRITGFIFLAIGVVTAALLVSHEIAAKLQGRPAGGLAGNHPGTHPGSHPGRRDLPAPPTPMPNVPTPSALPCPDGVHCARPDACVPPTELESKNTPGTPYASEVLRGHVDTDAAGIPGSEHGSADRQHKADGRDVAAERDAQRPDATATASGRAEREPAASATGTAV